jgi:hypothetical protein
MGGSRFGCRFFTWNGRFLGTVNGNGGGAIYNYGTLGISFPQLCRGQHRPRRSDDIGPHSLWPDTPRSRLIRRTDRPISADYEPSYFAQIGAVCRNRFNGKFISRRHPSTSARHRNSVGRFMPWRGLVGPVLQSNRSSLDDKSATDHKNVIKRQNCNKILTRASV